MVTFQEYLNNYYRGNLGEIRLDSAQIARITKTEVIPGAVDLRNNTAMTALYIFVKYGGKGQEGKFNNEDYLKTIQSIPNKNQITILNFFGSNITDPNCEYIGDNFPNLQWLRFEGQSIDFNLSVKGLGKCKDLRVLQLFRPSNLAHATTPDGRFIDNKYSFRDMGDLPNSLKSYNHGDFFGLGLNPYIPVSESTTKPEPVINPEPIINPKPEPTKPTDNSASNNKPNQDQQGPNPNQTEENKNPTQQKEPTQQIANGDETEIRLPLKDMPSKYWENVEVSKGWKQYQDKSKELPVGIFVQNDYGKTTSQQAFESLQSLVGPESMDAVVKWKDLKQWLNNQKILENLNQQLSQRPTPEELNQLKNDYDKLATKVTDLGDQNNTLKTENTRLDTTLSQRDKDNTDLQNKLGNKDKMIAMLNGTIDKLKKKVAELETKTKIAQVEVVKD